MNLIITMPDLNKEGHEEVIRFYKKCKEIIYFRVAFLPKNTQIGDRCAIVSNGVLIGSHKIIDMKFVFKEESEKLSDGNWDEGFYIIRDGSTFEEVKEKIKIKGFRGFRYFDTLIKKLEIKKNG